ncbi:hypothetical protein [Microbispora rosea]|uniref:hypothetical protein n=1 Tax=Microbispora rosea TaxID=58117 RepID=UPI0004C4219C|nr:hypothetical protein [Microbispora rosea]
MSAVLDTLVTLLREAAVALGVGLLLGLAILIAYYRHIHPVIVAVQRAYASWKRRRAFRKKFNAAWDAAWKNRSNRKEVS